MLWACSGAYVAMIWSCLVGVPGIPSNCWQIVYRLVKALLQLYLVKQVYRSITVDFWFPKAGDEDTRTNSCLWYVDEANFTCLGGGQDIEHELVHLQIRFCFVLQDLMPLILTLQLQYQKSFLLKITTFDTSISTLKIRLLISKYYLQYQKVWKMILYCVKAFDIEGLSYWVRYINYRLFNIDVSRQQ